MVLRAPTGHPSWKSHSMARHTNLAESLHETGSLTGSSRGSPFKRGSLRGSPPQALYFGRSLGAACSCRPWTASFEEALAGASDAFIGGQGSYIGLLRGALITASATVTHTHAFIFVCVIRVTSDVCSMLYVIHIKMPAYIHISIYTCTCCIRIMHVYVCIFLHILRAGRSMWRQPYPDSQTGSG